MPHLVLPAEVRRRWTKARGRGLGWLRDCIVGCWGLGLAVAVTSFVAAQELPPELAEEFQTFDTERGDPSTRLEPEAAAAAFQVPAGFEVSLFAGEPTVRQPIAIAADRHARVWIVENYTYAEAAVGFETRLSDRIVVLEDRDGDGRADERRVFLEGGKRFTSVEIGHGGVWVLAAPELWFVPDRNEDLVPDGPPVVVLDGWDTDAVRHNIVNGLRWGPDGWLYGRHGILATSYVGQPGTSREDRVPINCGVWRYHPLEARFEVVASGTTNPWGMDWDELGELFMINTVIGHLWHVVPGVHFERMYGSDFDPHLYSLVAQTADHIHWNPKERWSDIRQGISQETDQAGGGHAHSGLLIYQESVWPEEYRGDVYALNLHGRRINRDHLERRGSDFVGTHRPEPFVSQDLWFRGIDLISGPDGQVWVIDWSDTGECHDDDGVSRSSGRVFELRYGQARRKAGRRELPTTLEGSLELAIGGESWWSRRALVWMADSALSGTPQKLERGRQVARDALASATDSRTRVRAIWAENALGRIDSARLLELLQHEDSAVRVWGVRLLADVGSIDRDIAMRLRQLATEETDGLVLQYLASALPRMVDEDRHELAIAIDSRPLAGEDRRLRQMIWYGLQPSLAGDALRGAETARRLSTHEMRRWAFRRLASEGVQEPRVLPLLLSAAECDADMGAIADRVVGIREGLQGVLRVEKPEDWEAFRQRAAGSAGAEVDLALAELDALFGGRVGIERLLQLARDGGVELSVRAQTLESLGASRVMEAKGVLLELTLDRDLGGAAARALRHFDDSSVTDGLLAVWPRLNRQARDAALSTLTARASSTEKLLKAVESGTVAAADLGPYQWRQMAALGSDAIAQKVAELWPASVAALDDAANKQRLAERLTDQLLASGRAAEGRAIYTKVCANCHRLGEEGGRIGPDLSGGNRRDLGYLIENLGAPSAQVADSFRTSLIELTDGQVIVGVILRQLPDRIEVQTKDGVSTVDRREIEALAPSGRSLMPDGLLDPLSDQEVADLIAYLRD